MYMSVLENEKKTKLNSICPPKYTKPILSKTSEQCDNESIETKRRVGEGL